MKIQRAGQGRCSRGCPAVGRIYYCRWLRFRPWKTRVNTVDITSYTCPTASSSPLSQTLFSPPRLHLAADTPGPYVPSQKPGSRLRRLFSAPRASGAVTYQMSWAEFLNCFGSDGVSGVSAPRCVPPASCVAAGPLRFPPVSPRPLPLARFLKHTAGAQPACQVRTGGAGGGALQPAGRPGPPGSCFPPRSWRLAIRTCRSAGFSLSSPGMHPHPQPHLPAQPRPQPRPLTAPPRGPAVTPQDSVLGPGGAASLAPCPEPQGHLFSQPHLDSPRTRQANAVLIYV